MYVLGGKTRTKEKYRVVYTDHQRQELENEFQFNRYITMRRKSELSVALNLSERQVRAQGCVGVCPMLKLYRLLLAALDAYV